MTDRPPGGPFQGDVDPGQVEAFVRKIVANRDRELQRIQEQLANQGRTLRADAHARARRLAGRIVERTREDEQRLDARHLYKVRSELSRQRWEALAHYREQARGELQARYAGLWGEPAAQSRWCRFWVQAAREASEGQRLRVRCGPGSTPALREQIAGWLDDYPGGAEVEVDLSIAPGLILEWPDHLLDATLQRQCEAALDEVMQRLARILGDAPVGQGRAGD